MITEEKYDNFIFKLEILKIIFLAWAILNYELPQISLM